MVEEDSDPDRYVTYRNCADFRINIINEITKLDKRLVRTETKLSMVFLGIQTAFALFYYFVLK